MTQLPQDPELATEFPPPLPIEVNFNPAGPTGSVVFDQPLVPIALERSFWTWIVDGLSYEVDVADATGNAVLLGFAAGIASELLDQVVYDPTVSDVQGLITGDLVTAFRIDVVPTPDP
jgi:hypothetical protein